MSKPLVVKIHVPTHYAWGNDDNPAVPKTREEYRASLVSKEGYCCLGFAGKCLGLSDEDMDGHEEPADCGKWAADDMFVDVDEAYPDRATSSFACQCMDINDAFRKYCDMSYRERMEKLKELGLEHGVDFQFTWEV